MSDIIHEHRLTTREQIISEKIHHELEHTKSEIRICKLCGITSNEAPIRKYNCMWLCESCENVERNYEEQ